MNLKSILILVLFTLSSAFAAEIKLVSRNNIKVNISYYVSSNAYSAGLILYGNISGIIIPGPFQKAYVEYLNDDNSVAYNGKISLICNGKACGNIAPLTATGEQSSLIYPILFAKGKYPQIYRINYPRLRVVVDGQALVDSLTAYPFFGLRFISTIPGIEIKE